MKATSALLLLFAVLSKDICFALRRARQANFEAAPVDPAEGPCTTPDGAAGVCTPTSRCTTFLDDFSQGRCTLDGQPEAGICCPTTPPLIDDPQDAVEFSSPHITTLADLPPALPLPLASPSVVNVAIEDGEAALRKQDDLEKRLFDLGNLNALKELGDLSLVITDPQTPEIADWRAQEECGAIEAVVPLYVGLVAQPGSPEAQHQFIQFTEESSLAASRDAFVEHKTASNIATADTSPAFSDVDVPLSSTTLRTACPVDPACPGTKYRSIDGSCNNLNNRNWGKAQRAFNRMMPPNYADGDQMDSRICALRYENN